jgi:hypothetical protein
VVESNGQYVHEPWFSGLCLDGEVAEQYEMDRAASPQEHEGKGGPGALALDGLGPITIFVGANNSGKTQQPLRIKLMSRDAEGAEVDVGKKIKASRKILDRAPLHNLFINSWVVEKLRSDLNEYIDSAADIISGAKNSHPQDAHELKL